jgi:eukaryotic-like serine/threonine-protein kinase
MAKVCPNCELTYSDDDFFCAADGSPLRSTSAEPDNLVGTVIADRYRVESILGEGGMGRVYRARHVRVPREAAIKVLRRALIADSYAVAAFNREARNAASVGDHPNVAAVYDFGETADGLVFLAMEFIEGETLTRRLEREPVLSPGRAVEIVRQIAAGLTAAHELPEPVVHRDLKPDNILLKATRDGSDWVKIVDFGIAKAAKRDTQMLTTPGLVVGTPRYMSPEQLTGGAIDARSDIYALGMIAFQMLSGRMPFASASREEESTIEWALQRLTRQPLTLEQVRPDEQWPVAALDAMSRALATRADDRIATATEFARLLARAFGLNTPSSVVGVVTSAPGPISSALQSAARASAPTAPLAAATVPGVAVPTTPLRQPAAAEPTSEIVPEVTRREPRRSPLTAAVVVGALVLIAAAGVMWNRFGRDTPSVGSTSVTPNDSIGRARLPQPVPPAGTPDTQVASAARSADSASVARDPVTTREVPPAGPGGTPSTTAQRSDREANAARAAERARAALDRIKSALEDPDAVAAAGNGNAVLRDITRLLPTLTTRTDSVEATYYAVEANLILERPAEACRLLMRVRDKARGTSFEGRIDRFLGDADLGCANR